uniref:Conserved secreted protein n=1 Tax=Schistosoma curassoni TaxID=6186 RepID=A0A183JKX6_9TREM
LVSFCFIAFTSVQHIDATDDNFVSAKEQPAKFAPIRRHIMKRNYLWDSRLGKRSMNREAFPWYNHDLYNYYNDDNFRGYYTGYDD